MTPAEFQYIKRAVEQLEGSLDIKDRVKIEKTMSQILARSAVENEQLINDTRSEYA